MVALKYFCRVALMSAVVFSLAAPARAILIRSPHSAEACLDCHRRDVVKGSDDPTLPSIIVPEGSDPHRVLTTTCAGCHPKDLPAYWLMILPNRRTSPPSFAGTTAAVTPASGKMAFGNSHDSTECGKCHKNKVTFTEATGNEKELVGYTGDMTDFCQRCHQGIVGRHFPRGNIPQGNTTCLTCHKAHYQSKLPRSLRDDYYSFIKESRDFNPHGGNLFCLVCHPNRPAPGDEPEFLYGPAQLNKLCARCHGGVDHHVLDRPSNKKTWKMDFLKYPLQEGKLACVTCHDQHGGQGKVEEGHSRYLLRGEPYDKMTDFCQKCHEEQGWENVNPHDQLTPDGEIISRSCLFCHAQVPDISGKQRVSADDFNDNLTNICTQCHDEFPHPDTNHIVMPSTQMQNTMRTFENRREVNLPLDFDGRVTCVTCHNPHEKGLMTGPDSVGADEDSRLRLTTFNEICSPCHGRH